MKHIPGYSKTCDFFLAVAFSINRSIYKRTHFIILHSESIWLFVKTLRLWGHFCAICFLWSHCGNFVALLTSVIKHQVCCSTREAHKCVQANWSELIVVLEEWRKHFQECRTSQTLRLEGSIGLPFLRELAIHTDGTGQTNSASRNLNLRKIWEIQLNLYLCFFPSLFLIGKADLPRFTTP